MGDDHAVAVPSDVGLRGEGVGVIEFSTHGTFLAEAVCVCVCRVCMYMCKGERKSVCVIVCSS